MSDIVMLLSNTFRPDPRVAREAKSLARAGHKVTIICWDREGKHPPQEEFSGYQVERVQNVLTTYGAGLRQILFTPRFWRSAAKRVVAMRPQVIHCHDLDTLPAGWWLKKKTGARLIYDAHEDYPAMMSLYLPGAMVSILSWLERRLLGRVDHIITASTVFADKLRDRQIAPIVSIGNYHQLSPFDATSQSDVMAARERLGMAPDELVVTYIGGFSRNRQLLPLIEAARGMQKVQVLLWGDGHQRAEVESAAARIPNVHYQGWLPADQVPLHMKMADIIYYCLRHDYPGAVYNAPNTLAQAMAAGRPVIANEVGDLGRIVRQTGCGILVPQVTPAAIRQAIESLRRPAQRQAMGTAGRAAAKARYNWAAAEQELNQVYARLLGER